MMASIRFKNSGLNFFFNASFKAVTYKFLEAKKEEDAKGKKGPKKKKS